MPKYEHPPVGGQGNFGARFVKITASGINESHPYAVTITKESLNYSR